ncbi:MAG TPA: hypothetical protein P5110_08390 [Candidatus Omnitrophota bacterium]|nr:hypothetical protein [Candidatus Omnitrophota bacterium]HRZ15508.1 hypothetical protein [Candidatus Omnitrophota bacterium]
MEPVKIRPGIRLLIFFYAFIILQNLLGIRNYGQINTLILAVMLGTLLYMIIGFIQRKPISRWIAIGFHAVYQALMIVSVKVMYNDEFIKSLLKDVTDQSLVLSKNIVLVVFILVSLCNIAAIVYLARNQDYFVDTHKDEGDSAPD